LDKIFTSELVGLIKAIRSSSAKYTFNFIKTTLFFSASDEEQKVLKGLPLKKEDVLIFGLNGINVFVCLFIVSIFGSFIFFATKR